MARTFVRASSNYLEATGSPVTAYPCTISVWYKPSSIANGTVVGIGGSTGTSYVALGMNGTGNAFVENNSDSLSAGTATNGVWAHLLAVCTSDTSRLVYLDGAAGTVDTDSRPFPSPADRFTVGGLVINGSRVSFAGGNIGEVAVWNRALTSGEIASMAGGALGSTVASGLVGYWPVAGSASPEPDQIGSLPLTVSGATNASDYPPVTGGAAPVNTVAPVVSGTAQQGQTLSATQGTWSPAGDSYTYQWQRKA